MPSDLQVDNIKDASATKTLATLSSSAVTLHSDITFPAKTVVGYEKNTTAISGVQNGSLTYTDITGSSITYTPTTGASYIVYECSFIYNSAYTDGLGAFRFLIDGSVTKNQDMYAVFFPGTSGQYGSIRSVHRMIYSASGWTSDKAVKMQFRGYNAHGSANSIRLHLNEYDYLTGDGSVMGSTDRYTDVDVTIYSVM